MNLLSLSRSTFSTAQKLNPEGKAHTPSAGADEPYESDAFFKRYGLKDMDKGGSEAERVLFGFADSSASEVRSNSHEHRRSDGWLPRFDLRIAKTEDTQVHQGAPWGEGYAYSMSNLDVEIVHDTR